MNSVHGQKGKIMAEFIFEIDDVLYDEETGQGVMKPEYKGKLTRCKDCRHWKANTQLCSVFSGLCTVHRMPPDGYCSEAKRKEEWTK